jgi:hypothetical protein
MKSGQDTPSLDGDEWHPAKGLLGVPPDSNSKIIILRIPFLPSKSAL